jgi:sulfide:quinone oxidoreductase
MLTAYNRVFSLSKRSFATISTESLRSKTADKKFKVVVVGGGPGGLSGTHK